LNVLLIKTGGRISNYEPDIFEVFMVKYG